MSTTPVQPLSLEEAYKAVQKQAWSVIEIINEDIKQAKFYGKIYHNVVMVDIAECIKHMFTMAGYVNVEVNVESVDRDNYGSNYEDEIEDSYYYEWSIKLPKRRFEEN